MKQVVMKCPKCDFTIVPPAGNKTSRILIAGEFPGAFEIQKRVPFVGRTGDILRTELARVGISLDAIRRTNLWLHHFTPNMYDDHKHFEWHMASILQEIGNANYVLLLGSEMAKIFLKKRITDVCGTWQTSPYFPDGKEVLFGINPAAVLHGNVGELRLVIQKLGAWIDD
jgi:uracil-DNA glycosylase family 4